MLRNILRLSRYTLLLFLVLTHISHHHSNKPTCNQNSPLMANTAIQALRLMSFTSSPMPQLIDKNDHKSIIDHFYRSIKQIIPLQNFHSPAMQIPA